MFQIKAMGGYTICHEKTTPQWEHNYTQCLNKGNVK